MRKNNPYQFYFWVAGEENPTRIDVFNKEEMFDPQTAASSIGLLALVREKGPLPHILVAINEFIATIAGDNEPENVRPDQRTPEQSAVVADRIRATLGFDLT